MGETRSEDQEAAAADLGAGIACQEVGLFLEQQWYVEHHAVFGLAPGHRAIGELRTAGLAHGLLQLLLQFGFTLAVKLQVGTNRLQFIEGAR